MPIIAWITAMAPVSAWTIEHVRLAAGNPASGIKEGVQHRKALSGFSRQDPVLLDFYVSPFL